MDARRAPVHATAAYHYASEHYDFAATNQHAGDHPPAQSDADGSIPLQPPSASQVPAPRNVHLTKQRTRECMYFELHA